MENNADNKKNIFNLKREDLYRVPDNINFAKEEEHVLNYWQEKRVFEKCMELSAGKPKYTFYDGPPFATGLPHYGHILAGTIKDIVTRYAYQQGYHVDRRFGWDCHGLPVEFEIDKLLNIQGPDDVNAMGIAAYNAECRKIVMRYANEWQTIITRMGRWVDFDNDYKTLYPWFMETIWWVFKQLYDKGLIYEGVKVMPYSTACNTPLSNFESGQNYKEVIDPCVVVALELLQQQNTYILIWTTTPWTLPSNYACCVNPNMDYVKVENLKDQRYYILAESRLSYVYKKPTEYRIINKFLGKTLEGLKYKPIFDYFKERGNEVNAFRVLCDNYVTEDSGTGIVHNAPYFGEDDYRVCLQAQLITKSSRIICPVDESGRFTKEVTHFQGLYVKDADKKIIDYLKHNGNILVSLSQVKHMYPYCWRSDTPLIYKAVPSWFVRVEHMSKQLLACSAKTYWVPEFVKEKRFGNWLKDARDWAVSRNRYWGTPIPIWTNGEGEFVCIGSIKHLHELTGIWVKDLHRENIDHITIPSSKPNGKPLSRIPAVFDCWFESGSMPFAQQHYPFDERNAKEFLQNFPADFIAEGIDQTRGWFYTLLVISTALFNQAPYKNLIANGLILAADGQKMSKRKKNYPDPMHIVHQYGADALRLYLINSPVVRAENLRFKEDGVRDVIKDVFLPWYNAFRFLLQNISRFEKEELNSNNNNNNYYTYDHARHMLSMENASIMDVWIISFKESLLEFFAQEMKLYHLYTVVPRLTKFIDQLTNWYIRLNRLRIKGEFGKEDCIKSLDTLYDVLFAMVKMMAPFTPFISEHIYQRLALFQPTKQSSQKSENLTSVHLEMMPKCNVKLIRPDVEKCVSLMQSVIELGRIMRDRRTWPIKYPVREIIVIHRDTLALEQIKSMESIILSELNARKMTLSNDRKKYGVTMRAEPDHKLLGQRLKSSFKAVMSGLKALKNDEIQEHMKRGHFIIAGERLELEEVRIIYVVAEDIGEHFEAHSDNDVLVLMDMQQDAQLMDEGLAREIINRIQKLKKKADLIPTDTVTIYYEFMQNSTTPITATSTADVVNAEQMLRVIKTHGDMIVNTVKSEFKAKQVADPEEFELINEIVEIKQFQLKLIISTKEKPLKQQPMCLNIILANDIELRYKNNHNNNNNDNDHRKASIFIENGHEKLTQLSQLQREIELIFGLYGMPLNIMLYNDTKNCWLNLTNDHDFLHNIHHDSLLYITRKKNLDTSKLNALLKEQQKTATFCAFKENNSNSNNKIYEFIENPLGIKL